MNSGSRNTVTKIILCMVYLALLYLIILCGIFIPSDLVKIVTLIIPILVIIFLFCLPIKEETGRIYTGFLVLIAFFIDIVVIFFTVFLFGVLSVFLPGVFYHILFVLIPAFILGANVFFISPGSKLMKIHNSNYQLPVLLHNFLFLFCTLGAVKFNFLPLSIISCLYIGINAFFFVCKKTPFTHYLFRVNYYN